MIVGFSACIMIVDAVSIRVRGGMQRALPRAAALVVAIDAARAKIDGNEGSTGGRGGGAAACLL